LDPRFVGYNPAEEDGVLKVIKMRNMSFFGGEVKPLVPCGKILWHGEETYRYEKIYFVDKIHGQVSPALLFGICWLLPESSDGLIR
jgi:hypothetical protein